MSFVSALLVILTGEDIFNLFFKGIDLIKDCSEQYLPIPSSTGKV